MPKYRFAPLSTKFAFWLIGHLEKRPKLMQMARNFAEWYNIRQGYRKLGLLKDDLVPEDHPLVQEALNRLSEKEIFDRTFRLKRATELSFRHEELPLDLQPQAKDDIRYLRKHMLQIMRENQEEAKYEQDK